MGSSRKTWAAINAVKATAQHRLAFTPLSVRKAAQNPARRELIIPFGDPGVVALVETVTAWKVIVLVLRHQREKDRHRRRSSALNAEESATVQAQAGL